MSGDQLDLDAMEARANAATSGPWRPETWVDQFGRRYVLSGGHGNYEVERLSIMSPSDAEFIAHARDDVPALVAEVRRLRAWKAEALPVMDGLQELGGALGLPLGSRITGREAVDAALDLHNEARRAR